MKSELRLYPEYLKIYQNNDKDLKEYQKILNNLCFIFKDRVPALEKSIHELKNFISRIDPSLMTPENMTHVQASIEEMKWVMKEKYTVAHYMDIENLVTIKTKSMAAYVPYPTSLKFFKLVSSHLEKLSLSENIILTKSQKSIIAFYARRQQAMDSQCNTSPRIVHQFSPMNKYLEDFYNTNTLTFNQILDFDQMLDKKLYPILRKITYNDHRKN